MAKNNNQEEAKNSIDNLNDNLTKVEQRVQNNQKTIMWTIVALSIVIILVLGYIYFIRRPAQEKAQQAIGKADVALITAMSMGDSAMVDSAVNLYSKIADKENRGYLMIAMQQYEKGKYKEALENLKKYDIQDNIVGAGAQTLEGDCYVNMNNLKEALSCYDRAIKTADKNPTIVPVILLKKATVLNAMKDYKAEAEVYRAILKDYSNFLNNPQGKSVDIQLYLDNAERLAGGK